ncbi:transposase [Siccirubricoccus soli]|uniref:transposase n=1 Tax=Siccirubricoccus soli TaxID=2899147 RepID=UPI003515FDFE
MHGPQWVLNLTGTVLHTHLGHAPPPEVALAAMAEAAGATDPEFDLRNGQRGERDAHLEALLCLLSLPSYRARNVIERAIGRLKDWRRIHTRYDKLASTFAPAIAAIITGWC